jgi:hypothetical protein
MIWKKSWIEVRARMWMAVIGLFAAGAILMTATGPNMMKTATNPQSSVRFAADFAAGFAAQSLEFRIAWMAFLGSVLPMMVAGYAVLLGGAGINAQTNTGMAQVFHGSMLYTLSLPVSRMRLLHTRALAGTGALAVVCATALFAVVVGSRFEGRVVDLGELLPIGLLMFLGGLAFFALSTLLAVYLNEMWQALWGISAIGVLSTAIRFVPGAASLDPFKVMSGERMIARGAFPVFEIGMLLLVAAAFYGAAMYALQKREF